MIFLTCCILGAIPYVYYLVKINRLKPVNDCEQYAPPITVVVNAYKEGERLFKRLTYLAETHYPKSKMQVFVVNDGADEETEKYAHMDYPIPVTVISTETRLGKNQCINDMLKIAPTDIVVFTDADVTDNRSTIPNLVSHFKDRKIGAVTGDVVVIDTQDSVSDNEMAYRSVYGSMCLADEDRVINFNGQIMACRRSAVPQISLKGADDCNMACEAIRNGYATKYVPNAKVYETQPLGVRAQFKQKVRRANGLITSIIHARYNITTIMRAWMTIVSPIFFLGALVSGCFILPPYTAILFPLLVVGGYFMPKTLIGSFMANQIFLLCGLVYRKNISKWDVVKK